MLGYAREEVFTKEQILVRVAAVACVKNVTEREPRIRCHELARAVRQVVNRRVAGSHWDVVDGSFGLIEHTWLQESATGVILDPYRPGCEPMVQLIDPECGFCPFNTYIEKGMRTDIDHALVRELEAEMRGIKLRGAKARKSKT